MESKKEIVRRIFNVAFNEDPTWNRWYFDVVYKDAEAEVLHVADRAVSTLMMHRYTYRYCGAEMGMAYIFGAATAQDARGKGYMSQLMVQALNDAYARGDAWASLIPARDHLYFFYDKFGFATTIYLDCEYYTSVHTFGAHPEYRSVRATFSAYNALEKRRAATVLHTPEQFDAILSDVAMSKGIVCAVHRDGSDYEADAIAFAVPADGDTVTEVRDLLAVSEEAGLAVLEAVSVLRPGRQTIVWTAPGRRKVSLRPRGMMRIVNVQQVLSALAAHSPQLDMAIRVHDSRIPDNNGVFVLKDGVCTPMDSTIRRLSLDVDVSILTAILCSAPRVGDIFGLPTWRPQVPLMLD